MLNQTAKSNAGSQAIAKKPMNTIRNRYRDVLPIDATRVTLNTEDNDYINANFVKVEEVGRTYILTQGPLQHTSQHLWQMVWEQKSAGIVMLNKCTEKGQAKCWQYWPEEGSPPMTYNEFVVENLGCEDEGVYRLNRIKLENTQLQETRLISHFHYTHWPDFGVPDTDVFLDFLYAVRSSGVLEDSVGPCVVHCSAGIGRSGTFCLVDVCLKKIESTRDLNSVNLQEVLLNMRKQRMGLIQTHDQLRFSYIAILQGAYQILGEEAFPEFDNELQEEEESEEEEEEESDDSNNEGEKYPNLTNPYRNRDEDIPPPIPPRPPETFISSSPPPPPPPSTLPPGPPVTHSPESSDEDEEEEEHVEGSAEEFQPKKVKLDPAQSPSIQNGHLDSDDEVSPPPPPIPPRSQSLSPEHTSKKPSEPSSLEQEEAPPILPPKGIKPTHFSSPRTSEREAHLEERHVPNAESLTSATSDTSEAIQKKKQERDERQNRIASRVTEMKERLKETDASPEWSAPLMVMAFGVVVGYFAYAVIYSS
ncbi:hypothetical protein EMCRGX_G030970 [Ephydatia muelleri]